MPVVRVEMWEGRSIEQKQELVRALTDETARIAGCAPESIYVIIHDVPRANWGSAGELVAVRDGDPSDV